jgi:hypothetical protein
VVTAARHKRALVAGAWRAAARSAVRRRDAAVRAAAPISRKVQLRRRVFSWCSGAAAAVARRERLPHVAAAFAATALASRALHRWRLRAALAVHAALMLRRALHHRRINVVLPAAYTAWVTWTKEAAAKTQARRRAFGKMAMRRAALALAAWWGPCTSCPNPVKAPGFNPGAYQVSKFVFSRLGQLVPLYSVERARRRVAPRATPPV